MKSFLRAYSISVSKIKLYLQSFFINWKDLIEMQHIENAKEKRTHESKKEILTAGLFMHKLMIFSASINLKNIFANKQGSHELLIISE